MNSALNSISGRPTTRLRNILALALEVTIQVFFQIKIYSTDVVFNT